MGSQRDGRSVGVRANVEDFAEAGVNEDPCGVDEDCRAVVSTELDLPHDGVTAIYVNLQRRQIAFAARLLDGGVDGVFKGDLG
jgi:hypothetical protein